MDSHIGAARYAPELPTLTLVHRSRIVLSGAQHPAANDMYQRIVPALDRRLRESCDQIAAARLPLRPAVVAATATLGYPYLRLHDVEAGDSLGHRVAASASRDLSDHREGTLDQVVQPRRLTQEQRKKTEEGMT